MLNIIVAHCENIILEMMARALHRKNNVLVIGTSCTGQEAIRLTKKLKPNVLLLDENFNDMKVVDILRKSNDEKIVSKIGVMSSVLEKIYITELFSSGVTGYVHKGDTIENLFQAIITISSGNKFLSPKAALLFIQNLPDNQINLTISNNFRSLTPKELEIVKKVAEGYSSKKIAEILFLSKKTVDNHRYSIMDKLGCNNVAELVKYAIKHQIINTE
ncbi:MAG: response regulator transcription factor [Deltaproteobacteria bacterium]|nr:response regulator transcription factor [Deltaproteobacteria bacterium]